MGKNKIIQPLEAIDKTDRRILCALDRNARMPLAELARFLRLGRDIVTYRVDRLQREGILRRFLTVINPNTLGLTIFKTYLKLESNPAHSKTVIASLKKHRRLVWLAQCDGSWDLMLGILERSPSDYWAVEEDLFQRHGASFSQWQSSTVVESHAYHRQYLIEGMKATFLKIGGDPPIFQPDSLEQRLLSTMSEDARMPISHLADALDTTPDIIRYRLERLEKSGVICGYRADIDLSLTGFILVKAMVSLRQWDAQSIDAFERFCAQTGYVTFFIRQIGRCQIELEVEVMGYQHYYQLIDHIKQAAPKLVRDVETAFMRDEFYKWSSLPL